MISMKKIKNKMTASVLITTCPAIRTLKWLKKINSIQTRIKSSILSQMETLMARVMLLRTIILKSNFLNKMIT